MRFVAYAVSLAPLGFLVHRFRFVCDDAFITFRYSRNLARGLGPVYNPAPEAPVEGYSEPAWMLLMAVPEALRLDVASWSQLASAASAALLLWRLVGFLAREWPGRPVVVVPAAVAFATLPPVAVWSTGGMATMPFALALFLLFEAAVARAPRPWILAALAAAVATIRADGAYFSGLALGVALVDARLRGRRPAERAILVAAAALVAVAAAHVAWRYAYYGDVVPNTARAKLGMSGGALARGGAYVLSFALTFPAVAAVVALAPALLRSSPAAAGPALALTLGTVAYAVATGGDFMAMFRFLVPALPFVAILSGMALDAASRRYGRPGALGAAGAIVALNLGPAFDLTPTPESLRGRFWFRGGTAFRSEYVFWQGMKRRAGYWSDLGRALRLTTRPGESLVADAIGAVGYFSDLVIYDQRGLVSPEVARLSPLPGAQAPGHDRLVGWHFFDDRSPTYLHASLEPAWDVRPTRGVETVEGGRRYLVEAHPLDRYGSFAPGLALVLLRPLPAR